MYRDTASTLDEHDRAVGAILIGEALVDTCEEAGHPGEPQDRWRAFAAANDAYPEIWRHLDRARRVLAQRGLNTAGYDELRPQAPKAVTRGEQLDHAALDEAKRAIAELKLAVPGADWDAIEARTAGLVSAPLSRKKQQRILFIAAGGLILVMVLSWFAALVPAHKQNRREVMRNELAEIAQERKVKIDELRFTLGNRCEPTQAHELVKLLVLDGRGPDAAVFGEDYVVRCGEDDVVEHWAHAPRPGH